MKNRNNVCFIGCVDLSQKKCDGQTLKTRLLYNELKEKTNWKIFLVDTSNRKKIVFTVLKSIIYLFKCKKVIMLLSIRGRRIYFKILRFIMFFRKIDVYHDIIGGYFSKEISKHPKDIKICKLFKYNFVETKLMLTELEQSGLNNGVVVPNFRAGLISQYKPVRSKYNFVIFSRIMEEKGIIDAINAVDLISDAKLKIYGPISSNFKNKFFDSISGKNNIEYCGVLDRETSSQILSENTFMLFPTRWIGEGFPGTILDSFYAGLPIIASDWGSNSELITNGVVGYIYPLSDKQGLYKTMMKAVSLDFNAINKMRKSCLEEAKKYSADTQISKIISLITE